MTVLELILLSRDYVENQEGEVITLQDSQMAKIKNIKYLQLHGLIGPDILRENLLINTILDKNIDDVLSNIPSGPKKDFIKNVEKIVNKKFNNLVESFLYLRHIYFNRYNENRKDFALTYKNENMFSTVMKSLNIKEDDVEIFTEKYIKDYILKITRSLNSARQWLNYE